MHRTIIVAVLCAFTLSLQAQVPDQIRQATIGGSRGTSGKCTIEVRVDITAEVDIAGDSGRLRTLAGQPATWTRMECSDPLPYRMSDFRFTGVDGRGTQRLVQDPRNTNGVAVIRIEDPKSGAEGYTFDIEWRDGSGGYPTNPFANSRDRDNGRIFGRNGPRNISNERAIELCRSEVRVRAERDYGMRNVDVTAAAIDSTAGRNDWVTGSLRERNQYRRNSGYRFNCGVNYTSGQVHTVELMQPDGTPLRQGNNQNGNNQPYDQNRVLRACQDAVVSRTSRDGYENVRFISTGIDNNRSGWVTGSITANRGPVGDTFDFGCSMDFRSATVRNVELNRR